MLNIEMSVGEETDDSDDVSWVNNGPNKSADEDDDESVNEEGDASVDEIEVEGDESVGEEGDESVDEEDDEIELVDLEDELEKPSIKKTPKPKQTATKQLVCKPLSGSKHLTSVFPALSQCARFLYVASGNEVFVYSTQSGEKTFTFTKHEVNVVGVQGFAGKKDLVWSCDQNGQSYLWNHNTGAIIKKHWFGKTRKVQVFNFYAPHEENIAYVLVHFLDKGKKKRYQFLRVNMAKGIHRKVFVEMRLQTGQERIAFGCGRESPVVAAATKHTVMVENVHKLEKNQFSTNARKFTCVALHPDDSLMAVGDISGRILIFRDLFKLNAPISSIHHWHTLPVRCLAFSDEGSFLLSGGEENTLVKWNMESGVKNFLPRMGAPLRSIACAPGNEIFVTAHSNNTVRVISPLLRIVQSISGMVKHEKIPNLEGKDALVPTGLVFDPRSRAVILNGLTGHLQFYDVEQDKLLYNLDITNSNIVTHERHQQLVNKEVVKVAISSSGTWLATVERWPSPMGSVDLQLKFWHFDITKQTFVLNTQVAMPHEDEVHSIAFQPGECNAQFPLLVTTGGQDGQFKIWRPVDETDIYGSKVGWNCDVVGEFRHLPAEKVSFSEDGSLLVVAFHEILTVWEADTAQLKTTLSHNCITSALSWVEFGRKECCHMLMCGFKTTLLAWDLLSLTLKWKVNLRSPMVSLAVDPESDYMAVITDSNEIFTFQPSSATLAFHETKLHGQRALAATFIPRIKAINSGISWLQASELVFIDEQQNLVLVQQSSDSQTKPSNRVNLPDNLPFTPFAALRAQTRTSDIKGLEPTVHTSRGIAGFDTVQSLLENPGSTLPPVNRLCGHFLESLLSRLDIKKDNKLLLIETEFPDSREEERRIPIHRVKETHDNFKWLIKQSKPKFRIEQVLSFKCSLCDFLHLQRQGILDHAFESHQDQVSQIILSEPQETLCFQQNDDRSSNGTEMADICAKDIFSDCEIVQHLVDLTGPMELDQVLAKNECISKETLTNGIFTSSVAEDMESPSELVKDNSEEIIQSTNHSKLYSKRCAVNNCGFKFLSDSNLSYHRRCHDPKSPGFACPECLITHPQWKTLSLHLWKTHGLDIELYSCDVCPYKTHSYSTLVNIHRRIHCDDRPFLCDVCGKGFKTGKQLRNHRMAHPEFKGSSGNVEVSCDLCQHKFADKYRLQKHNNRVHLKVRPYLCSFCGFTTSSCSALKMHLRQHTGEKPFSCDICNYQTNDHNSLRRHKMRHSGDKRYKCPECSYSCIQSSSYKSHLNSKHSSLNQSLTFRCPSCPFQCLQEHKLKQHQLTHHENEIPQPTEVALVSHESELL